MMRDHGKAGRSFGLMLAPLLLAAGAYRAWHGFPSMPTLAMLAAGALSATVALLRPALLDPLARVWLRLGEIVGMVVRPIVLAAIFFLLITPIAIIARWLGRDELRLKRSGAKSYWVVRAPPQPNDTSFEHPF